MQEPSKRLIFFDEEYQNQIVKYITEFKKQK